MHGFGHLFLLALGGPPPAIELSFNAAAIGYLVVLLCFWIGVLNVYVTSLPMTGVISMAFAILTAQYILDVPGELSFTFTQSVILTVGAIDQLLLREKGFTYFIVAASQLPLFVFFFFEMTQCSSVLALMGGHTLYDTYLAILPFCQYYIVTSYETSYKKQKLV